MIDDNPATQASEGASADPSSPPATAAPALPYRRNTAMWTICVAVLVVTAITAFAGARVGSWGLAVILAGAGIARATIPGPGPVGITIRSRTFDVSLFFGLAAVIAVLAQTAPNI